MAHIYSDDRQLHSVTQTRPRHLFEALGRAASNAIETLWVWHDRSRQRRQLAALTMAQLDDIGLSPSAADFEADKPFWRA